MLNLVIEFLVKTKVVLILINILYYFIIYESTVQIYI